MIQFNCFECLKQEYLFNNCEYVCCLLKEMKMLDKEVRVWDVYMGLESTVKNLLTSLRAVNELQNSAVRERHWQQLMNTTGVGEYLCCCYTVSHTICCAIFPFVCLSVCQ